MGTVQPDFEPAGRSTTTLSTGGMSPPLCEVMTTMGRGMMSEPDKPL